MTRTEFLAALRSKLSSLPEEEQDAALKYYEEYFDEADSEEEAARQLGSPEDIAVRILGDSPSVQSPQPAKKASAHSPWFWVGIVILCILASPMLISLGAAVLAVVLGLISVLAALILAVVCPFIVLTITFFACFILMLYLCACAIGIFTPGSMLFAGIGLLFGALSILSGIFTGYLFRWIGLLFRAIFRSFRRKKGAEA